MAPGNFLNLSIYEVLSFDISSHQWSTYFVWYEAKKWENVSKISQPTQSLKECFSCHQSIPLAPLLPPTKPYKPLPHPEASMCTTPALSPTHYFSLLSEFPCPYPSPVPKPPLHFSLSLLNCLASWFLTLTSDSSPPTTEGHWLAVLPVQVC